LDATGPYITAKAMDNLRRKVSMLYEGDYFVMAGNTPEYLEVDVTDMLRESIRENVKVVLDTNPSIVKELLHEKPFMIKTTPSELKQIVDCDSVIDGARKIYELGARYVLVVCDNTDAIFVCKEGTYQVDLTKEDKVVSFVGTGDSLIAGFLMNYLRSKDAIDSFRFGCSCGSATAYSKGLATREKIDSFYKLTEVDKID